MRKNTHEGFIQVGSELYKLKEITHLMVLDKVIYSI